MEFDTEPHAVMWQTGQVGLIEQYSKWHWTDDANKTLCGRRLAAVLPKCDDLPSRVTCKQCKAILLKRGEDLTTE